MIIPHRTLLRLTPDSVPVADVLACRATVRFSLGHSPPYVWSLTLPDGQERSGSCETEQDALQRAAWAIADWCGAWECAS